MNLELRNGHGLRIKENAHRQNDNITKENILNTRIVNLSSIELTQSETNLLRRGLNFCPTPPPPKPDYLDAGIDAFARRINLKEYYAPEYIDEINQDSSYHSSVLEKLSKRDRQVYYRQSRESYLNSYVTKLRQDIRERLAYYHRFQRDKLNKQERVALRRLSNNKDIIIKPADKGGATEILALFSDGPGRSRSRTLSLPRLMDFIQGLIRDVMTPLFFPRQ